MFGIEFTPLLITKIVFVIVMAGVSIYFGKSFSDWLRNYKIIPYIWNTIKGNTVERDKIRRQQMKEVYKDKSDIMAINDKKPTLIQKIYRLISMSGIPNKLPGFSETAFLVLMVIVDLVIFAGMSFQSSILAGAVVLVVFDFIVYYLMQIMIYNRAIVVEDQMIDFINLVASTSRQYSNIIDIFGSIYEKFKDPLKTALEEAYVEEKQINNLDVTLYHLKEKFDSVQFEFVIDNLLLCSKENGQYFDVAMDLSAIANVYYSSFQKKKQILRQAKINLTIMLALSIGIMIMMGQFIGGGVVAMVTSTSGIIICSIMALIYLYAMNMKAR